MMQIRGGDEQFTTPCKDVPTNHSLIAFDENKRPQLAETWDVFATEATMIQLELYGDCSEVMMMMIVLTLITMIQLELYGDCSEVGSVTYR